MYSESHCHLNGITKEKIREAEKADFTLLLTSGIDLQSSIEAANIAKKYDIVKGCIGVHPWYSDEYNENVEKKFRNLAKRNEVIAVSEIGLDFFGRMTKEWIREEKYIDRDIQIETLSKQLKLARELDFPVIVHDRSEGMELLDILIKSNNIDSGIAIHGFSKDKAYAEKAVKNNIYLSIGLRSLQNNDLSLLKTIENIPLDYLLTETDSGDPMGILAVCDKIAEIKATSREIVGALTTRNLMKLCKIE
jgi:TatD DNase family protein